MNLFYSNLKNPRGCVISWVNTLVVIFLLKCYFDGELPPFVHALQCSKKECNVGDGSPKKIKTSAK